MISKAREQLEARMAIEIADIEKGGETMPMFIGFDADGRSYAIAAPHRNDAEKLEALTFVKLVFLGKRIVSYLAIHEAWFVEYMLGDKRVGAPADQPDRQEALMVIAVDREGAVMKRSIIRRAGGESACSPIEDCRAADGLFLTLLPDANAAPTPQLTAAVDQMLAGMKHKF